MSVTPETADDLIVIGKIFSIHGVRGEVKVYSFTDPIDNLLDYKLCTMLDHPDLKAEFVENFEPTSPFGTKALGEPPACPGAPAIRNAILNATGVAVNQTPMTPHILFERFKEEGLL